MVEVKGIFVFGLLMIILSSVQYGMITRNVESGEEMGGWIDYVLFIYVILSLGVLYFNHQKISIDSLTSSTEGSKTSTELSRQVSRDLSKAQNMVDD